MDTAKWVVAPAWHGAATDTVEEELQAEEKLQADGILERFPP